MKKKIKRCSELILFALLCVCLLPFNFLNNISYSAVQADTTTSQLVPGQSFDTGNHIYPLNANTNSSLWTNVGTAQTNPTSPFSVSLVNNIQNKAGYALFNGVIDMTKPVDFSGTFGIQGTSLSVGDSLGFILSPLEASGIVKGQTGSRLGIGGLPNTVFIGRDLYYNTGTNGDIYDEKPSGIKSSGSSNVVVIRSTDANGILEYADGKTGSYNLAAAPDIGKNGNISEKMEFTWTPNTDEKGQTVINSDGTVGGILSYTETPGDDGQPVTVTSTVSLSSSLYMGVIGATGGNYGTLSYSSANGDFNAHKGTQNVQVNYLDKDTDQSIANALPSTIVANVGDELTVFGKQPRDAGDTYSYLAPEIPGYMFDSANPVVVANNDSVNNVINVYYEKIPPIGKAHFSYQYDSDVTDRSVVLPSINDTQGEVDTAVAMPELPNLSANYFISKVVTADGQQYATLKDALADAKYTNEELQFTLIVSKVAAPATSDKGSNEVNPKKDIKNVQAKQKPQKSTTVAGPEKKQSTKEKPTKENNESKDVKLPLTPPLAPSTLQPKLPRSSDAAAIKTLVEQSEASAHNLKVKVAGTAGLFAGGAVAFGTLTGLGKFAKLWKILKK